MKGTRPGLRGAGVGHQLRGRPKTARDSQWIYRLHSVALLAAAFRADEKKCHDGRCS